MSVQGVKNITSSIDYRTISTDVLIIGSQGAGTRATISAAQEDVDVIMVTKGKWGKDGASVTGDADLDVDSRSLYERFDLPGADPEDSKETFFEDTVKAGKYLNDQELVEIHVEEAPDRFEELLEWGLEVDRIMHTSGHSYPRGVLAPGTRVMSTLIGRAKSEDIEVIEETMITDLLTKGDKVVGAVGLNSKGEYLAFNTKSVILATGGAMRQYPLTTAPEQLTGDGQAMALRAGAELIDMEFPMFLPGSFVWPPAVKGVDVPFMLSTEGIVEGYLLNNKGRRFMKKWDPENFEATTRDIASVGMMNEILEGNGSPHDGVYVSLKHLPDDLIEYWLEHVSPKEWVLEYGGFDMRDYLPNLGKYSVESAPASHFFNGGIRIDKEAKTTLEGLYAAGEVSGGVHGGTRLSGNAFTEFVVWGHRAGKFAARNSDQRDLEEFDKDQAQKLFEKLEKPLKSKSGEDPEMVRKKIQDLAWNKLGIIRTLDGIKKSLSELQELKKQCNNLATESKDRLYNLEWRQAIELENMRLVLEMIAKTGIQRKESRASHYLREYPETDYPNWTKNSVIKMKDGEIEVRHKSPTITKLSPPDEKLPYGRTE